MPPPSEPPADQQPERRSDAADDLRCWLRLSLTPGLGGETRRRLLQACGEPAAIFAEKPAALSALLGAQMAQRLLGCDNSDAVAAALAWVEQDGNRILTLADADYPQALLSAADPPVLLYVKGDVALLNRPALAIVGSRAATRQGEDNARAFAAALAEAGFVIVSGMAAGIDAAAHHGALDANGATIAVVGTGIDRIYPSRNEALARRIAAQGAMLSEFALASAPLPGNFPRRNRLIAGMARGVLVVEANQRSGSLITARLAGEVGREVFAIPGSIHSPQSRGCHALIKQGAKLVETAQDILEELQWRTVTNPAAMPAVRESESDPLLVALGGDPCDLDQLAERTGLAADALLARLLPLELEGRVARLPGGRFQRLN